MTADPAKPEETGDRDQLTGRFLPGNRANPKGRPKGFDFRKVIRDKMLSQDLPVEDALWAIFRAMLGRASSGDVSAAKLLLDKLCETDPIMLDVQHQDGLTPPASEADFAEWASRFSQLINEPSSGA